MSDESKDESDISDEDRDKFIAAARKKHMCPDGEVEIDEGAAISVGDDPGAYVAAWVWVTYEEAGIQHESNETDD